MELASQNVMDWWDQYLHTPLDSQEIKIKPVNQTISIDLFNIYGQLIRTYNVPNQSDNLKLDIKESGVLYLRLRTKDHYLVKKLMVQH